MATRTVSLVDENTPILVLALAAVGVLASLLGLYASVRLIVSPSNGLAAMAVFAVPVLLAHVWFMYGIATLRRWAYGFTLTLYGLAAIVGAIGYTFFHVTSMLAVFVLPLVGMGVLYYERRAFGIDPL